MTYHRDIEELGVMPLSDGHRTISGCPTLSKKFLATLFLLRKRLEKKTEECDEQVRPHELAHLVIT